MGIRNPRDVDGCAITTLTWSNGVRVCRLGSGDSGANRHATQRPGHVAYGHRLVSASDEAAGSDEADPLAVGLIVPLGWSEEGESETTDA